MVNLYNNTLENKGFDSAILTEKLEAIKKELSDICQDRLNTKEFTSINWRVRMADLEDARKMGITKIGFSYLKNRKRAIQHYQEDITKALNLVINQSASYPHPLKIEIELNGDYPFNQS